MTDAAAPAKKPRATRPAGVAVPVRPVGRPSVYDPKFCEELMEFFSQPATREVTVRDAKGNERTEILPGTFPTLARFAAMIGVTRETLHDWATAKTLEGELRHPEFSFAYKKAKEFQEANLVEGTLAGAYNSTFAIFTAKNVLGWRDKTEQEITGKDGAPLTGIQVSFVTPNGTAADS